MATTPSPFRGVERFSLFTTAVTFLLLVLGNAVRATGSGLSYLTWPLYNGRVLPDREFHVLMEFSHRAVAGTLTVLVLALAALALRRRETRARLAGLVAALLVLLALQVVLGALTVWKLLAPVVVVSHLLAGQLTFATMLVLHLVARAEAGGFGPGPEPAPPGLRGLFGAATAATLAQIALGGLVSSHNAGLAVPDFPTFNGRWIPPLEGAIAYQALHRFGAYALALLLLVAAWRARRSPRCAPAAAGPRPWWCSRSASERST